MINKVNYNVYSNSQSIQHGKNVAFKSSMDKRVLKLAKKICENVIVEYDPNLTDIARCQIKRAGKPEFEVKGKNFNEAFNKFLKQLKVKESYVGKFYSLFDSSEDKVLKLTKVLDSSVDFNYSKRPSKGVQIAFPCFSEIGKLKPVRIDHVTKSSKKNNIPTGNGKDFKSALVNLVDGLQNNVLLLDRTRIGSRLYKVIKTLSASNAKTHVAISPVSLELFDKSQQTAIKEFVRPIYGMKIFSNPDDLSLRPNQKYFIS